MSNCIYCSNSMLRHIRGQNVYWFCRHCWQEVPDIYQDVSNRLEYKSTNVFTKPHAMAIKIH